MNKQKFFQTIRRFIISREAMILFSVIAALAILLIAFNFYNSGGKPAGETRKKQLQIRDKDSLVTINDNGLVEFKNPSEVFYQNWDKKDVDRIFDYFEKNSERLSKSDLNENNDIYKISLIVNGTDIGSFAIAEDNSEINDLFDFINEQDDSEEDFTSGDFEFLASPSPGSSPAQDNDETADNGTNGGGGSSGGGSSGGGSGGHSDCPFWLLSYCVYPPGYFTSPIPSPSSIPAPSPGQSPLPGSTPGSVVQDEPACDLWGNQITGKAIISNTLCAKEEE